MHTIRTEHGTVTRDTSGTITYNGTTVSPSAYIRTLPLALFMAISDTLRTRGVRDEALATALDGRVNESGLFS